MTDGPAQVYKIVCGQEAFKQLVLRLGMEGLDPSLISPRDVSRAAQIIRDTAGNLKKLADQLEGYKNKGAVSIQSG